MYTCPNVVSNDSELTMTGEEKLVDTSGDPNVDWGICWMVVLAQRNAVSNDPRLTETEEGTLAKGEGCRARHISQRGPVSSKHDVESSITGAKLLILR